MGWYGRAWAQAGLAGAAVASLLALSAAPGAAAAPVAQASASAVTLTVAGQTRDSGSYQANNDGTRETTSGSERPAITVLGGQSLISAGTLAQDATTSVVDGQGHSAACAGLAGPGATVASAGDSATCLTPGQALTLNPGTLSLSSVQLVGSSLLQGVDTTLAGQLTPVLTQLLTPLQAAVNTATSSAGLGLDVGLGAVTSSCTAGPRTASGTSHLLDAGASVTVGGQQVNLVNLPVDPAPNTHVVTGLGDVATSIENALSSQLDAVLSNQLPGLLSGLQTTLGLPTAPTISAADQATILNNALSQVGAALAPLQDNLLDITLNAQTRTGDDQISVTALDVKLLPVAQQLGVNAFELKAATSSCGPSGRVAAAAPSPSASPVVAKQPKPSPKPRPRAVPTAVPAGVATATPADQGQGHGLGGLLAIGGLLAVGVGAAGATVTSLRSRPPAEMATRDLDGPATPRPGGPGGTDGSAGLGGLWRIVMALGVLCAVAGLLVHGVADKPAPYADLKPADPVRLEVASLGLDASVVPITVSADRVLEPPGDTREVGWWQESAQPGHRAGQTVITGHTVHTGGGVMDRLPDIHRGATVDLVTGNGTMRYRVQAVRTLSHDQLAQDSQAIFGQSGGDGRLVLVTCDDYNGSYYESNVVVTAAALGRPTGASHRA